MKAHHCLTISKTEPCSYKLPMSIVGAQSPKTDKFDLTRLELRSLWEIEGLLAKKKTVVLTLQPTFHGTNVGGTVSEIHFLCLDPVTSPTPCHVWLGIFTCICSIGDGECLTRSPSWDFDDMGLLMIPKGLYLIYISLKVLLRL